MKSKRIEEETFVFNGFVLLSSLICDWDEIIRNLKKNWNIRIEQRVEKDNLIFEHEECMVIISYIPAPVPADEVEKNAERNYMWKKAKEAMELQKAQLIVAVMTKKQAPLEAAKLHVKIVESCLRLSNAIGYYGNGTVYQPEFYCEIAEEWKEEGLPVMDLVFPYLYQGENGTGAYTMGLKELGKQEIEILDTAIEPAKLQEILCDICYYVLSNDAILRDGDTIGLSEEEHIRITQSDGVCVEGESIKIHLE